MPDTNYLIQTWKRSPVLFQVLLVRIGNIFFIKSLKKISLRLGSLATLGIYSCLYVSFFWCNRVLTHFLILQPLLDDWLSFQFEETWNPNQIKTKTFVAKWFHTEVNLIKMSPFICRLKTTSPSPSLFSNVFWKIRPESISLYSLSCIEQSSRWVTKYGRLSQMATKDR